jgi:peroxiredoxin
VAKLSELFVDARYIFTVYRKIRKHQRELDRLAPKAGDKAPVFTLTDVSGERSVTLSYFRGVKPVALVFGSYT